MLYYDEQNMVSIDEASLYTDEKPQQDSNLLGLSFVIIG